MLCTPLYQRITGHLPTIKGGQDRFTVMRIGLKIIQAGNKISPTGNQVGLPIEIQPYRLFIFPNSQNGMIEIFDNKTEKENLTRSKKVLENLKVPYEVLETKEINSRFKPFHFEGDYSAIFESVGGTLMANKCLQAFQVGVCYGFARYCM